VVAVAISLGAPLCPLLQARQPRSSGMRSSWAVPLLPLTVWIVSSRALHLDLGHGRYAARTVPRRPREPGPAPPGHAGPPARRAFTWCWLRCRAGRRSAPARLGFNEMALFFRWAGRGWWRLWCRRHGGRSSPDPVPDAALLIGLRGDLLTLEDGRCGHDRARAVHAGRQLPLALARWDDDRDACTRPGCRVQRHAC